jgi:ParB family chromosome partitioning protein
LEALALSPKGDASAVLIEHLKKGDMAREAERLLDGTGWLPEPLRLPVIEVAEQGAPDTDLPDFLNDEDGEFDPLAIAAE